MRAFALALGFRECAVRICRIPPDSNTNSPTRIFLWAIRSDRICSPAPRSFSMDPCRLRGRPTSIYVSRTSREVAWCSQMPQASTRFRIAQHILRMLVALARRFPDSLRHQRASSVGSAGALDRTREASRADRAANDPLLRFRRNWARDGEASSPASNAHHRSCHTFRQDRVGCCRARLHPTEAPRSASACRFCRCRRSRYSPDAQYARRPGVRADEAHRVSH